MPILSLVSQVSFATKYFTEAPRISAQRLAAPQDPEIKINFMKNQKGVFFEPRMGGDLGILRNEDRNFDLSARGLFVPRFEFLSNSFDLWNIDFVGGMAASWQWNQNSFEGLVFHKSSHLGPDIAQTRPSNNHSYEVLQGHYSRKWDSGMEFYSGLAWVFRADPELLLHKLKVHMGANFHWNSWDPNLYGAIDLESDQVHNWSINSSWEIGYELGVAKAERRRQRVFVNFYSGYSQLGQFFQEKEEAVSFGLAASF